VGFKKHPSTKHYGKNFLEEDLLETSQVCRRIKKALNFQSKMSREYVTWSDNSGIRTRQIIYYMQKELP
jgi:hypothetical protein